MKHAFLGLLLGLTACANSGSAPQQSLTDRDTYLACRQQAELAYRLQNRDEIYSIHDSFTPQSSTGLTQIPSQPLADRYAQERMVDDCIRNTGTENNRGSVPPAPVSVAR
jgi:hypothetical protein